MNGKTKRWWKAAGIRAVKTMAQGAVAMLPVVATISAVDWGTVLGTAVLMGVESLLTSLAGLPEVKELQQDAAEDSKESEAE